MSLIFQYKSRSFTWLRAMIGYIQATVETPLQLTLATVGYAESFFFRAKKQLSEFVHVRAHTVTKLVLLHAYIDDGTAPIWPIGRLSAF